MTKEFEERYALTKRNELSRKWQNLPGEDYIAMGLADMDFAVEEKVRKLLAEFIEKGDYGYMVLPSDYKQVFIDFNYRMHGVSLQKEWIFFANGAVDALHQLVIALTQENDAIIVATPIYNPFKRTIRGTDRLLVESDLINDNGHFSLDYEDIEKKIVQNSVKMMLFCSPHNPVGRVWSAEELDKLFEICQRHGVIVVSDEVHGELTAPGIRYIPALALEKYHNILISLSSVSKTFSSPLFTHCHVIIPDGALAEKFDRYQKYTYRFMPNTFSALVSYYLYRFADSWLAEVRSVIKENYEYFCRKLSDKIVIPPLEGSYLVYADFSRWLKEGESAADFLKEKCHIIVNRGEDFDSEYTSYARFNLATTKDNVTEAVRRILEALN